jgi:hypothetical protein
MEPDKRRLLINSLVEEINEHFSRSGGTINEKVECLLDQAWELLSGSPHKPPEPDLEENQLIIPIDSMIKDELKERQESMDADILDMLKLKESFFASLAEKRPLKEDEKSIRSNILDFINEIERKKGRGL